MKVQVLTTAPTMNRPRRITGWSLSSSAAPGSNLEAGARRRTSRLRQMVDFLSRCFARWLDAASRDADYGAATLDYGS